MSGPSSARPLGLAHLSLLSTRPPDLVSAAAGAGFDFVGLRVQPATAAERGYDLRPGSPLLAETLRHLDATGLTVLDIEFLLLDGSDQRDTWQRMLEAGHALGASTMTVGGADPEPARLVENLYTMAADARDYGILPALEPMSYQRIGSIPSAAAAAREAGIGIVVDALHFRRAGGTIHQISEAAASTALLQISDAPARQPAGRPELIEEARTDRLPPGDGDLGLPEIIAALPAALPVSIEAPSPRAVSEVGPQGWAKKLKAAADRVLATDHRSFLG